VAPLKTETGAVLLPIEGSGIPADEAARRAFAQECRTAYLQALPLPAGCEEALQAGQQITAQTAEGTLLELLGYDAVVTPQFQRENNLQDADALVRTAGSGQGIRAEEAAAIIAAQRGAIAPPGQ
jgi:hypothetical protein